VNGKELRAWMAEHGYSYRALARDLDCNPSSITAWLNGTTPISRRTELALVGLLA